MKKLLKLIDKILKSFIFINIRFYKLFMSPFLGINCRYYPTCSDYMRIAIEKKGILTGLYLGFVRLIRCNPWGGSGYDPVEKDK